MLAKREASAYTIRLEGSDRPLTLRPEPVLKWSNPVVGMVFGEVFVWTDRGRPEAVASIYKYYSAAHSPGQRIPLAGGAQARAPSATGPWSGAPSRPGLEYDADRRRRRAGRLCRLSGFARCARWRRSSPAARPPVRAWTATCAC